MKEWALLPTRLDNPFAGAVDSRGTIPESRSFGFCDRAHPATAIYSEVWTPAIPRGFA